MSKRKQKPILSDKIAELIAPRRLLDPEIDSEDETAARAFDYEIDEEFDSIEPVSKLSDIRKKNVKLLQDVDAKYRGKVSSRKELEMDSSENEQEDDSIDEEEEEDDSVETNDDDDDDDEEVESTEKSIGELSMLLTPRQRIKLAQETGGNEEENGIESDESSENDDDLKAFTAKLGDSKSANIGAESDSDEELVTNENGELEKWDDDYEGEEIEEEQSENESAEGSNDEDEDGKFDSDEEESDFDGGDIIPRESKEPLKPSEKQDVSRFLPKQRTDDHLSKGFCVQNQLQIWEKLLEVRIHSQKMLIKANSLPQPRKFEKLSTNTEFSELANDTMDQVSKLVSQMRNLQSLLLNQYSETKQIATKRKPINLDDVNNPEAKRIRLADELEKDYSNFKEYQYSVISKWHDRTKVLTPGSIKTQKQQGNIDVLRKIEGVLANRDELIKKTQLLKGGYELFDKSTGVVEPKQIEIEVSGAENVKENEHNEDNHTYCSEVYDDTDFYHTQLRELIEYKTSSSSNANEMAKQFAELQKLRKKMKKTVDTRASKGRKIRYVVHNKLVSFMAPNESGSWNEEQKDELFKSLFGAQS